MPFSIKTEVDLSGLENFLKTIREPYKTKVGVLDNTEEATIGATHEFGSVKKNIPQRSFIESPLKKHLFEKLKQQKFDLDNMRSNYVKLGVLAIQAIQEAFESSNDGEWQPIKQETADRKGSNSTLIDTGHLRKSISYKIEKQE
jgi:hypothetical protein